MFLLVHFFNNELWEFDLLEPKFSNYDWRSLLPSHLLWSCVLCTGSKVHTRHAEDELGSIFQPARPSETS
jgi:hypothetical protein